MSQTNDIHPQLGAPPPPMTEEGTTGVPAGDDTIADHVGPADDTPIYDDLAAGDDVAVEDDPVAGSPEEVVTEEHRTTAEDPTPPDVPVVVRDDAAQDGTTQDGTTQDSTQDDAVRAADARDGAPADHVHDDDAPVDHVHDDAVPADDGSAAEDADVETSTTEPAPVVPDEPAPAAPDEPAPTTPDEPAVAAASSGGLGDLGDSIGHVFDQTNGMVDGLQGESDGTAEGDDYSGGERSQPDPRFDDAEVREENDGVADLRDPNP